MYYIQAISSITHQASFQTENVYDVLSELEEHSELQSPNYASFIHPSALRRLSPVLRMGIAAAKDCQEKIKTDFDAISVGTALGCLSDTEKFLVTFNKSVGDVISPSAFIQSTHNTISGQISLELKNHAYNMTHTQNNLSFETALMDGMMCCDEGYSAVLVGAADEAIGFLENIRSKVIHSTKPFTSGATFFVIGTDKTPVGIIDSVAMNSMKDRNEEIDNFLSVNGVLRSQLGHVFMSDNQCTEGFSHHLDFTKYVGLYYTASAFGVHLAHDWLKSRKNQYALVVNEICPGKLGMTLLSSHEI
jgi:hypothetical protein